MTLKNVLLLITPSSPGRFDGIARFARVHGWHLTVADRLTHALNGWSGDGALVTLRDDETVLRQVRSLRRRGIPVVDLTAARPDVALPRVCGDNSAIGHLAAEHFRSRYYRNVAWYSTGWGHQHELRHAAFAAEFPGQSVSRWVWTLDPRSTKSDDWKALSRWLEGKLAEAPKPLGVFCFDDADASRVESAAIDAGLKIPDDVAVLGAGDDHPLCESQFLPISSVHHDLEQIGYRGAELLERLMSNPSEPVPDGPILIPPGGITERASTDALAVNSDLVRRAVEIYRANLAHPPSTVLLAERLGISRPTLDRAFAADLGLSPAHLLARLRLDEAKRLLRDGTKSIAEISYSLGYCNPAYFTNTFRAATGQTPKSWRAGG